ncbi:MAG: hypothetical protein IJQ93_14245 [Bacteroidales bacterium]|nr:hypothetical protein [Bacteroidales bacterium]MBR0301459.1 hypothetical protein [Bacteroidales bacterium]
MESNKVYLVKSKADLEAVRSVGINNVICYEGLIEMESQWRGLNNKADTVIILYEEVKDADDPQSYIMTTGDTLLACGINVLVSDIGSNSPVDEVRYWTERGDVNQAAEEFRRSFDYIDYLVYTKYLSSHTPFDKAEVIKRIALSIDKMSDVVRRRVYLNALAETVQVPVEVLLEYIDKVNELPF